MCNASKISPTLKRRSEWWNAALTLLAVAAGVPGTLLSCKGENEPAKGEQPSAGSAGEDGSTGRGGSSGQGGVGSGGAPAQTGGDSSRGGAEASGGSSSAGSNTATGGTTISSGGAGTAEGGSGGRKTGSGGSRASGGTRATGGASASGGKSTSGGASASGGKSTSGGTAGNGDTGGISNCSTGEVGTSPNCFSAPPAAPASGKKWQVTFSEEFNGTDYDHGKLSPCFDWNYGECTNSFNNGREHYDPGQVQVNGGTGKLIAAPLSPALSSTGCYQSQCTYKSGLLSTCRPNAGNGSDYLYAFTYGYVEARLKFPGTRGFFTAFWMLPANPNYDYRSEIDIVEILGDDPESIFMTYHYNDRSVSHAVNNGTKDNGACPVKDYSTDFHNFGIDWQSDHVAWYIDGVKCDEFKGTTAQIENGPMQIILDLMVDHDWQQRWDVTLQDTTLVRQLEIDYLRVYQQK